MKRPRRPWLQFSLRGFLIALTVSCVWLATKVEKARKRGRAINAVLQSGGDHLSYAFVGGRLAPSGGAFLLDLKSAPIDIRLTRPLNAAVGAALADIYNIDTLSVWAETTDAELPFLERADARTIILPASERISPEAQDRLRRKLPNTTIESYITFRDSIDEDRGD